MKEQLKRRIKELGYWLEDRLKSLCGEITPDKRLTVILIMLLGFTILNLYFTFTTIRNFGREQERKEQLKIGHMKGLELERTKPEDFGLDFLDSDIDTPVLDSMNIEKKKNYG